MNSFTGVSNSTQLKQRAAADASARATATLLPPVDVIEDSTGITLYADLPGVSKDRVQVRVEGEQLLIEGEMALALADGLEPMHAEIQRARFHRAFTLSKELDVDQVSAEMSHGVLKLRIPKAAHAQARRVQIHVA